MKLQAIKEEMQDTDEDRGVDLTMDAIAQSWVAHRLSMNVKRAVIKQAKQIKPLW